MPLLSEYTLSFIDNDKVVIDVMEQPSEYEKMELLRFFRRHRKEIFVEFEGEHIFFIVAPWKCWVEFLIDMGFRDAAVAVTEVLNDLELDRQPTVQEYVEQLKKAKIVKVFERSTVEDSNRQNWEYLKEQEVRRLTCKEEEKEEDEEEVFDDEAV